MMQAMALKVSCPNRLAENESITSFEDWRNNLIFYLSQEKDFKYFLKETTHWRKTSAGIPNRGLDSIEEYQSLKRFLGVIAGLSPPLLYNDLIHDTTSIVDVFKLLRGYYQVIQIEIFELYIILT